MRYRSFIHPCFLLLAGALMGCSDQNAGPSTTTGSSAGGGGPSSPDSFPLYFTTMTHMEGGHQDDTNEILFDGHVGTLRDTISLASTYDARITIESEIPFATGCVNWGVNMMLEIHQAGHGVASHCDMTIIDADQTTHAAYVAELKAKKTAVDGLVGAENNLGCSGAGGGTLDWVNGVADAGFGYINATVSMHYLSMTEDKWPDDSWTAQYIKTQISHEPSPADLYDRIYLRKLADSLDFEHDVDGRLVLSSGGLGRVDEQVQEQSDSKAPATFTNGDVDALVATLSEVDAKRDPSRVAKIEVHLSLEHLRTATWDVLTYFFAEMQRLQNEGTIQWATQAEVYQTYLDSLAD